MRALIISIFALASLAGAARAAEPSVIQDLDRYCVAVRAQPTEVARLLDAEHWDTISSEMMPKDPVFANGRFEGRFRRDDGRIRLVIFGTTSVPTGGENHPMLVCAVLAKPSDEDVAAELKATFAAPDNRHDGTNAMWAVREHDGRRDPLAQIDNASLLALADKDELAFYLTLTQAGAPVVVYMRMLPLPRLIVERTEHKP